MAQKTSWTGATLTESDINAYLMGEGGAWTTWTPAITQVGSVTCTVNSATYGRWGRLIVARVKLTVTGSGTGGNAITSSVPVTAAFGSNTFVGTFSFYDASAVAFYIGGAVLSSTTSLGALAYGSGGYMGASFPNVGLAVNDEISYTITYEAAT